MFSRNYYYLVAGLPDIVLEQSKLSVSLAEFREELKIHLHPDDYNLVEQLFLTIDNRNVLNMLLKNIVEFDSTGKYSFDELEDEIKEAEFLPDYLKTFITQFKTGQALEADMSWEDQLTMLFYDHTSKVENEFLRSWFEFERDLKNILAGLSARRHKIPVDNLLIGNNTVSTAIRKSNARDFGLNAEFPFVEKLIQINENTNLLEREKAIDQLRWNHIDDINTFNYFTIEVILGFVIKLSIVERWLKLDKKTGEEMFRRLLKDLENSYEFPKEFNV
ncbi:MAG: DUF2764 family protein [Bacteroidales bacterium]|nr:DUF2764 family protein [Bacteroidales bacterium]